MSEPITDHATTRLANLMGLQDDLTLWSSEELGQILRHQMAAPLLVDLCPDDAANRQKFQELTCNSSAPMESFDDLLHHPAPPLDLLMRAKRFAKASSHNPDSPLPQEVATVLYYLTMLTALLRCRQRITRMSDTDLRNGLEWVLRQPWITDEIRRMCDEGLREPWPTK